MDDWRCIAPLQRNRQSTSAIPHLRSSISRLRASFTCLILTAVLLASCDDLIGAKSDATTEEIFEAGRSEPGFVKEVEYVPLFPFFTLGGNGAPLNAPTDVYVGYDEFIYVTDAQGLHVLDLAGRPANFIPIEGGALSVIQDRRFDLYVTARRDTLLDGRTWNLPVVLHYSEVSTGAPVIADIIWHPFDDDSRRFNRPDPIATDEEVEFTGVAVLPDNSIYVSRRGPVNNLQSVILPHDTILEFNRDGVNTQAIISLSPVIPSLRSSINPADVLTFVHPPQRQSFPAERHFMIAQTAPEGGALRFPVLSIRAVETPDGIAYVPDTEKIQSAAIGESGAGFLYEEFKFENPTDLAFAADGSNYIFVVDSGTDSLYAFTSRGVEGVAPPPGATTTSPVNVSFGGEGDGALQFRDPNGVAYFDNIVYVADTGNDRLSRFRLNTDFE